MKWWQTAGKKAEGGRFLVWNWVSIHYRNFNKSWQCYMCVGLWLRECWDQLLYPGEEFLMLEGLSIHHPPENEKLMRMPECVYVCVYWHVKSLHECIWSYVCKWGYSLYWFRLLQWVISCVYTVHASVSPGHTHAPANSMSCRAMSSVSGGLNVLWVSSRIIGGSAEWCFLGLRLTWHPLTVCVSVSQWVCFVCQHQSLLSVSFMELIS